MTNHGSDGTTKKRVQFHRALGKKKENLDRDQFFTLCETSHLRGHSKKIYKQPINKTCRQKFFSLDEWNQLPENVIAADSVESFKKRLDNHVKSRRDEQYKLLVNQAHNLKLKLKAVVQHINVIPGV